MLVYSIGHSNHSWEFFLGLLQGAKIDAIVDVRSLPRSRFPHFGRSALSAKLSVSAISYFYLGAELGGRPAGDTPLTYEQMAATLPFADGLDRVVALARRHTVALMCAEHDPLTCHRALLVGRHLVARGADLQHILRDGRVEPQREFEDRHLATARQTEADLFAPRAERLALAYRNQEAALYANGR